MYAKIDTWSVSNAFPCYLITLDHSLPVSSFHIALFPVGTIRVHKDAWRSPKVPNESSTQTF